MSKKPYDPTDTEAPFNMSMLYYISLSKLMELNDKASIVGDLQGWYQSLRAIYRKIIFKINKDEREVFDKLFLKVRINFNTPSDDPEERALVERVISDQLDKINQEIIIVMDKKKMIFPNITVDGIGKLMKRYDLDEQ